MDAGVAIVPGTVNGKQDMYWAAELVQRPKYVSDVIMI